MYSFNGLWHWIRGALLLPSFGSRRVLTQDNGLYVWRNNYMDGYKIGTSYLQQPGDLANYLLVRTRERMLLENKVHSGSVLKSQKPTSTKFLSMCREDLTRTLPHLERHIYVVDAKKDEVPVAFASNAMYVMERNGVSNRALVEKTLVPVLKQKMEYLHAEGVA